MEKLKPSECESYNEEKYLDTTGIFNEDNTQGISVDGGRVILNMPYTEVVIPGKRFKMMAEWYVEADPEVTGIHHNDQGITLKKESVSIEMGHTKVDVPKDMFKAMAQWYLCDQDKKYDLPY